MCQISRFTSCKVFGNFITVIGIRDILNVTVEQVLCDAHLSKGKQTIGICSKHHNTNIYIYTYIHIYLKSSSCEYLSHNWMLI